MKLKQITAAALLGLLPCHAFANTSAKVITHGSTVPLFNVTINDVYGGHTVEEIQITSTSSQPITIQSIVVNGGYCPLSAWNSTDVTGGAELSSLPVRVGYGQVIYELVRQCDPMQIDIYVASRPAALPTPFSALSAAPPPTQESPADRLPRDALRAYCASAGDTMAQFFNDGRTGPPLIWRCVKGAVYTCEAGADGVACSARSRSRVPLFSMVEACRSYGRLSVADGAYSTVWRWECHDGKPVIAGPQVIYDHQTKTATPVEFDAQGYANDEWTPLH